MAYGTENQRQILMAQEATAGLVVTTATARWQGPANFIDAGWVADNVGKNDNVGLRVALPRMNFPYQLATLAFPEALATFEQIHYLHECGCKKVQTAAADGAGAGKIYDYPVDEVTAATTLTMSIQAGDNNAAHIMEYAFPIDWTETWAAKGSLMVSSNWVGRQKSAATFTALAYTVSTPVEAMNSPLIYIHDSTIGSGGILGTIIGYQFKFNTGIFPNASASGNTYFYNTIPKTPSFTLSITYEHDANCTAEYAKYLAGTPRLVRIKHEGSALTPGSAYSKKTYIKDLGCVYTSFPTPTAQDGDNIITAELSGAWSGATSDLFAHFILVNTLATLT
jgi:hypothetical protein